MIRTAASILLLATAAPAFGADLSVGVGLSAASDMPDRVSSDHTRFPFAPGLQVPVRIDLSEGVRLRVTGRFDVGRGSDRVSWTHPIDGKDVRFYDDDHLAILASGALLVGAEADVPGDLPVVPYLGAQIGLAWVGTYHSLGGEDSPTQILLDPEQNDLGNPNNIDPYTTQTAFQTDVYLGGRRALTEAAALWLEIGYSLAFVDAEPLRKTPEDLDARREAYGWNPLRVGLGVSFTL